MGSVLSFWAGAEAEANRGELNQASVSEVFMDPPFWQERAGVYERIQRQRAILVSVRSQSHQEHRRLRLQGAGHVRAPKDFAFARAIDFAELPKVSPHIVEARYNPERSHLFLHTRAFNYHARMLIHLSFPGPQELSSGQRAIDLQILEGVFAGMRARLLFHPVEDQVTEISLRGFYDYQSFPIPSFFASFGLEVVMQRVASRLRQYVEDSYVRG